MTWCKILQIYGLSFVQVASLVLKYAFGVTLFWTANCSSAESLIFWMNLSWAAGKYIFHDTICNLGLCVPKKYQEHVEGIVIKINVILDSPDSYIPL